MCIVTSFQFKIILLKTIIINYYFCLLWQFTPPASFLAPCFKFVLTKMPSQKVTRAKAASRREYMQQQRQAMSEDQKKAESAARLNRKHRSQQQKREQEARIARRKELDLARAERQKELARIRAAKFRERTKAAKFENLAMIPTTPNSKSKFICDLIETSTPQTTSKLQSMNIVKARDRHAGSSIVESTASSIKEKVIRKTLIPKMASGNKKAISQRLNISRNHFYYSSQKGKNPRTSTDTINLVIEFYKSPQISTKFPNKQRNNKVLHVMKFTQKKTYRLFIEEYPNVKIGSSTFNKLRPAGIKLRKFAKWQQCLCDICDNVKMLSSAIKLDMERHNILPPLILSDKLDLAKASVCDLKKFCCLE